MTPGGPADVRELTHLTITKVAVDPKMSNNCYLLRCRDTGDQVLIDAADGATTLLPLVGDAGLAAVVTTHQHWDHHRALADVVAVTGASVVAGAPDAEAITEQTGVPVTRPVAQGDTVAVGDCALEVIAIAGHTPGSIALLYDDPDGHPHLFTGDSLFPGGVGNTFGDKAAFAQLVDEVSVEGLRPAAGRHLVLPGARGRLHARRRAGLAPGVAPARLVNAGGFRDPVLSVTGTASTRVGSVRRLVTNRRFRRHFLRFGHQPSHLRPAHRGHRPAKQRASQATRGQPSTPGDEPAGGMIDRMTGRPGS